MLMEAREPVKYELKYYLLLAKLAPSTKDSVRPSDESFPLCPNPKYV